MQKDKDVVLISVIIVTCSVDNYFESCLNSLNKQTQGCIEIIVIDNSPNHDFSEKWPSLYKSVKTYSSEQNLFYCASLNKGIGICKGDFILCLNDDVILDRYFIQETLQGFFKNKNIGMVSGKILRPDKKTIDSTGLFLSFCRTAKERGYGFEDVGQFGKPGYIFGVNGAVAFYRREMLEQIKRGKEYFDEDFRFYYEDLDIAWRAQNAGWKAYYVPTAIAYHARGATARKKEGVGKKFARFYISDELQFELIKNRYLTIIKNEAFLGLLLHLPFMLIYDLAVFGFLILFRPKVIPMLVQLPRFVKTALKNRRFYRQLITKGQASG